MIAGKIKVISHDCGARNGVVCVECENGDILDDVYAPHIKNLTVGANVHIVECDPVSPFMYKIQSAEIF